MNILTSVLIWIGIGISVGIGFCLVFTVIGLLFMFYEKLFPNKKSSPFISFEEQLYHAGANVIFLSPDLFSCFKFEEAIKDLRLELWQQDIVVPFFQIAPIEEKLDFTCYIRIGGHEAFKGNVGCYNSGEEITEAVISRIRGHFLFVRILGDGEGNGNLNTGGR